MKKWKIGLGRRPSLNDPLRVCDPKLGRSPVGQRDGPIWSPLRGMSILKGTENFFNVFCLRSRKSAELTQTAEPPPPSHGRELYALSSACRVLFASLKVFLFYEALIFLSWSLTLIHLIIENFIKDFLMGVVTAPTALFLNAFASFQLPESLQKLSPLIPALKSNWLIMHVTVMLLSYATLICGCLLAMTFLFLFDRPFVRSLDGQHHSDAIFKKTVSIKKRGLASLEASSATAVGQLDRKSPSSYFGPLETRQCMTLKPSGWSAASPLTTREPHQWFFSALWAKKLEKSKLNSTNNIRFQGRIQFIENKRKNLLQKLDQLSFRAIGIGFPFLTIGILSGSVWANEAWGSYWNWDPKETWSLITWIIFAIYLHLRFTKNWNGLKSAILATIGFLSVWICFLGVNFLAKGLHSYGWLV